MLSVVVPGKEKRRGGGGSLVSTHTDEENNVQELWIFEVCYEIISKSFTFGTKLPNTITAFALKNGGAIIDLTHDRNVSNMMLIKTVP